MLRVDHSGSAVEDRRMLVPASNLSHDIFLLNHPLSLFTAANPFPPSQDYANTNTGPFKHARFEILAVVLLNIQAF
jgi:hypothetical protein